ncbi:MAG: hypothetical protein K2H38_13105 [Muribaculaceae bacterium]|nr:hypothetical protein [Muribaculaceae bacterium]MDE6551470.1 hypothetical protein [Muribaculaceae bacterium]
MKRFNIILLLFLLLAVCIPCHANNKTGKQVYIQKYKEQLKTTTNARDSVRKLYYLFDLSDREGQKKYAWDIYHTAGRAGDVNSQLDMLRNLATFYAKDDSVISLLLSLTDKVQNEEAKASTKTFILNQQLSTKSKQPDDTEFQTMLLDSITKSHNLEGKDVYDRLSLLYQIIQYLGVDADGVLFKQCLDAYAELIDDLPVSDYPLKNQFYTTAAMIHSRINGNPVKAIQFDRNLLEIIEQLQQMYIKKNRKFRNYDTNKFICYRRMMSNYSALQPDEIQEIHDSILALYNRNIDVKKTMDYEGQAFAFYYMAIKDYKKAIPAIKGTLQNTNLSSYQRQKYYGMLMEAAKAENDRETYVMSMEHFIRHSNEIDSLRKLTMKREIMLRDSILPSPLLMSVAERNTSKARPAALNGGIFMVLSGVLALLLIVYMVLYFRQRLNKSKR